MPFRVALTVCDWLADHVPVGVLLDVSDCAFVVVIVGLVLLVPEAENDGEKERDWLPGVRVVSVGVADVVRLADGVGDVEMVGFDQLPVDVGVGEGEKVRLMEPGDGLTVRVWFELTESVSVGEEDRVRVLVGTHVGTEGVLLVLTVGVAVGAVGVMERVGRLWDRDGVPLIDRGDAVADGEGERVPDGLGLRVHTDGDNEGLDVLDMDVHVGEHDICVKLEGVKLTNDGVTVRDREVVDVGLRE